MTIAGRLKRELAARRWSIRRFQKKVAEEAPGVRGSKYASVHDYVEKGLTPSLPFLRVAATVLGVRVAWLAFGEEPMYATDKPPELIPAYFRCPSCGTELLVTRGR